MNIKEAKKYIASKDKPPTNAWSFLYRLLTDTKEGLFILAGIFFILFLLVVFAFIIIYNNPSIINVNIK